LETGVQIATWPTVVSLAKALGVDCTAFTEEASDQTPKGRGRPPKAMPATPPAADLEQTSKKRKRAKK